MSGLIDSLYQALQTLVDWFVHFLSTGSLWYSQNWLRYGFICIFLGFLLDQIVWLVRRLVLEDRSASTWLSRLIHRISLRTQRYLPEEELLPIAAVDPEPLFTFDSELSFYDDQARMAEGDMPPASTVRRSEPVKPYMPASSHSPFVVQSNEPDALPDVPDWDDLPPEIEAALQAASKHPFSDDAPTLQPANHPPQWKQPHA